MVSWTVEIVSVACEEILNSNCWGETCTELTTATNIKFPLSFQSLLPCHGLQELPHGSWSGRTLAEGIQALGVDISFL